MASSAAARRPGNSTVLSQRALNRALLARQLLLERADLTPEAALEHLAGMQAQAPHAPYVGLWTRLADFQPEELSRLIAERRAVRAPLMRTTLHLVSAADCLALRPLVQPVLERGFASSPYARGLAGLDLAELLAASRELLDTPRPQSPSTVELGTLLHARWPERAAHDLAHAVRYLTPLVQTPPRGLWRGSGQPRWATVERWLGRPLDATPDVERMTLRYLAAYGPASVKDIQAWCWLTRLGGVVERLRPRLRVYRDEAGRELFDLPDAPMPEPDTPAPPRFLPEYDNALLSHADRTRIIADEQRPRVFTKGAALLDGGVCAAWTVKRLRPRDDATLRIEPFRQLTPAERNALADEGAALLTFVAEGGTHDIQWVSASGTV
jgi:hypothetical protein